MVTSIQSREPKDIHEPEGAILGRHLAFTLPQKLASSQGAWLERKARGLLARCPQLAEAEHDVQMRAVRALMAQSDMSGRRSVIEFLTSAGFVDRSRRVRLAAVERLREDPSAVGQMRVKTMFECVAFTELSECVQLASLAALRHAGQAPVVVELCRLPAFSRLEPEHALRLLSYLDGPSVKSSRRALIDSYWQSRRNDLLKMLQSRQFGVQGIEEQVDLLIEFLVKPSCPVYFADVPGYHHDTILSFGLLTDKKALSYEYGRQKAEVGLGALQSPSPSVAKSWPVKERASHQAFRYRAARIAREDELRFINWVETSLMVDRARFAPPKEPGAQLCYGPRATVFEELQSFFQVVTRDQDRNLIERGFFRQGRLAPLHRVVTPAKPRSRKRRPLRPAA